MGDFKRSGGKRFGGGGGGGGFRGRDGGGRSNFSGGGNRGSFGDRDRGSVTMHEAICDQCGKPCEVPFRPAPGKPVYCTACFGAKRDGGDDRGESRFPQRSFGDRAIQARTDFGGGTAGGNNDEVKRQLELLNAKMDRLIKAVEAMSAPAPFVKPVMVEEKVRETLRAAMNQNPVVTKPVDAKSAATIKPVAAAKPAKAKKTVKKGKK